MQIFSRIKHFFSEYYKPDLRALSLMRIAVALVVITDLCIRAGDLTAHYTDAGMWPRHILTNFGWKNGYWSFYLLNGSYTWALILIIFHFIFAVFLLAGYRTRLATFMVWLLYISLHNRNLFIQQAGDDLLRLVLLWGIFLPWQSHYAVDGVKKNGSVSQNTVASLGYLLLIASVYFFAGILKTSKEWWSEGSAIYYALSLDQLRLAGPGDWLYQHPMLMKTATRFVLFVEFVVPLLILIPSKKGRLRDLAFLLLLLLHLGIGLTLYVGLFFIIGMVSALGLLSTLVMNKFEKLLRIHNRSVNVIENADGWIKMAGKIICGLILVLCLAINFSTAPWFNYELRGELSAAANSLRLDQYWGMFSPTVLKKDGWLVYYGIDSVGRQWDLRRNEDYVDFSKPAHVVTTYKSDRWRKLAENMQGSGTFLRPLYCKYVLRKWNKEHPEKKIVTLNLFFMQKENLAGYKTSETAKNLYCVCIEN